MDIDYIYFFFFPAADINAMRSGMEMKSRKAQFGQCFPNTAIVFDKSEGSPVNLTGKSKGYTCLKFTNKIPI